MKHKILIAILVAFGLSYSRDVSAQDDLPRAALSAGKRYTRDILTARKNYVDSLEDQITKTKNPNQLVALGKEIERVKQIASDETGPQRGMFVREQMVGKKVLLMCPHRSYRVQLMPDGSLSPKLPAEHFWQINNGALEFLEKDNRTLITSWGIATVVDGTVHAFANHRNRANDPRVIVFSVRDKN